MEITYDTIIQATPYLFAGTYAVLGVILSTTAVIRGRKFVDALKSWGKPFVDEPTDILVKKIAVVFDITPEQVVKAINDVSEAEKKA